MPLYEYECPECGRFEVLQKFDEKPLKACPTCSEKGTKSKVTRLVSAAAFHLKGSGWYKTDYAASGSAGTNTGTANANGKKDAIEKSSDTSVKSESGAGGEGNGASKSKTTESTSKAESSSAGATESAAK